MAIERMSFVYDADGTVTGEIRYWFGTLFGAEHCSLCDITHSRWGKRSEFQQCAQRIGTPITYLHRDDLVDELAGLGSLAEGRLPCVIGHDGDTAVVLLDAIVLGPLHGEIAAFEVLLREALAAHESNRA